MRNNEHFAVTLCPLNNYLYATSIFFCDYKTDVKCRWTHVKMWCNFNKFKIDSDKMC